MTRRTPIQSANGSTRPPPNLNSRTFSLNPCPANTKDKNKLSSVNTRKSKRKKNVNAAKNKNTYAANKRKKKNAKSASKENKNVR